MSSDLRAGRCLHSRVVGQPENASRVRPEAGVDLTELKRGQCRYPVGELQPRQLLYCGKPSLPGESWCAAHRRFVRQLLSRLAGGAEANKVGRQIVG